MKNSLDSVKKKRRQLRKLRAQRQKALEARLKYNGNKLFLIVYIILLVGIGAFLYSTFTSTYKPVITGLVGEYTCDGAANVASVDLTAIIFDSVNTETNFSTQCYWIAGEQTGDPTCALAFEYYANGGWWRIVGAYGSSTSESAAKIVDNLTNPINVGAGVRINKTLQCGGMHDTLRIRCISGQDQTDEMNITCSDNVKPSAFINYPAKQSILGYPNVTFSCNATDNTDIDTVSLMANFTGTFQSNSSIIYGPLTYNTSANFSVLLAPGSYKWGCRINDTRNININFTLNYTLTIQDTVAPVITIQNPANTTYTSAPSLNYTVSDNFTIDTCSYKVTTNGIDPGSFISIPNCTNLSSIGDIGFNILTLRANDTSGNMGFSVVNFTIDAPPNITLSLPGNSTIDADGNMTFVCNITDDRGLVNVTLYHNISQSFSQNQSILISGTSVTANFTVNTTAGGLFAWNCRAADSGGNLAFAPANYTVIIDTSAPSVTLVAPQLNTNYTNGSAVLISATVTDNIAIDKVKANITLPNSVVQELNLTGGSDNIYSANFTNTSLLGLYNVTFIANDTSGNTNGTTTTSFRIINGSIIVNLISPANGGQAGTENLTFIYNVSSEDNIINCSLFIDFSLNQTNITIAKDVNQSFFITFIAEGPHFWSVTCRSNTTSRTSETWGFTSNLSLNPGGGEAVCPNAVCETGETCSSCAADCGACAAPPSSPGSGGGGGLPSYSMSLSATSPVNIVAGQRKNVAVTVRNTGANDLNDITVSVQNCPSGWGCGTAAVSTLSYEGTAATSIELFVPEGASGTVNLNIRASNDKTSASKSVQVVIQDSCTLDVQCGENRVCLNGACQPLFDLVIVHADSPIVPGEKLDITYFVWNKIGDSGDYTISYEIVGLSSGSEVVYLSSNEQKTLKTLLNVPTSAQDGLYILKMTLTKGEYIVSATQNIEILRNAPVLIDLYLSKLEILDDGTVVLAFDVYSNSDNDIPVRLEEKISKSGTVVWEKTGNVQVSRSESIQESVKDLGDGMYQLELKAQESSIVRTFKIEAAKPSGPFGSFTFALDNVVPIISIIVLVIIVAAAIVGFRKVMKKGFPKMPRMERHEKVQQIKQPVKEVQKNIETEKQVKSDYSPEQEEYIIEEETEQPRLKIEDEKEEKPVEKDDKTEISQDEIDNPLLFDAKKKKKGKK